MQLNSSDLDFHSNEKSEPGTVHYFRIPTLKNRIYRLAATLFGQCLSFFEKV